MRQSHGSPFRFFLALAMLFFSGGPTHGDVVVYQGQDQQFNELLERCSNAGADLGLFASFKSESCDGLFSAANGDIYALSNVLGGITILRYNAGGQLLATSHSPLPYESSGVVVRNSTLFMASAGSAPQPDFLAGGIYSVNAQTLAVNSLALATPANQPNLRYLSLALSPSGSTLYADITNGNSTDNIIALPITNGVIGSTRLFTLSASGALALSADGSRLFVGTQSGITWYSTDPADLPAHPFVATGSGGVTALNSYSFDANGNLFVTAKTAAGPVLQLYNGNNGAFISQLNALPASYLYTGGIVAAIVPECNPVAVLPLLLLLSLAVRWRKLVC